MDRVHTPALLTALVVLVLGGCVDDEPETAAPAPDATAVTTPAESSPPATEGSVTTSREHAWPDGVAVRLDKVERVDRAKLAKTARNEAGIMATITVRNTSAAPLPLWPEGSSYIKILYGANRQHAESEVGYSDEELRIHSKIPDRVAAGGEVIIFQTFNVPAAELDVLAVEVELPAETGEREPFLFSDAETLLK